MVLVHSLLQNEPQYEIWIDNELMGKCENDNILTTFVESKIFKPLGSRSVRSYKA